MRTILIITCLMLPAGLLSQNIDTSGLGIGLIIGGDTIIHRDIKEIWVYPKKQFRSSRQMARYWKLIYNIKKVWPYAKMANELLLKYEPEYIRLETRREKRQLIKQVEDELMGRYENELKKLTISQGRILIKLIDRETKRTSYDIIRDFRGGFIAFFWQSIARIFGNDLKEGYDPLGEDRLIEEIIYLIEIGYLE